MLQHINDSIAKYVCTLPERTIIRTLCLQRDNHDYILSSFELFILIDYVWFLLSLAFLYNSLMSYILYAVCIFLYLKRV